jgi:hypothetical protein
MQHSSQNGRIDVRLRGDVCAQALGTLVLCGGRLRAIIGFMLSAPQHLPIFVSSTFSDLQPYRAAVREALHRLETVVRGMEYFGASPETPKDECLRIVRSCKAYVGIFAMRYGSIDPDSGKSFTHLEYDEAQRIRLPSLIYLIDEERQPVLPRDIDFGEGADKLRELKATLRRRHVVSQFTTPDHLAAQISQDLPVLAERTGQDVDRSVLFNVVGTLPRHRLTDERFEFLKREAGESGAVIGSDAVLRETMEYLIAGERQAPFLLLSRQADLGGRDVVDVMMEIEKKIFAVVERGAQRLAEEKKKTQGNHGTDAPRTG